MPGADLDAEEVAEPLGRGDQQLPAVGNHAAKIIRQAAIGERHVAAALEDEDLRILIHAAEPSGTGSAAGHAADDQDSFVGHGGQGLWGDVGGSETRANDQRPGSSANSRGWLWSSLMSHPRTNYSTHPRPDATGRQTCTAAFPKVPFNPEPTATSARRRAPSPPLSAAIDKHPAAR